MNRAFVINLDRRQERFEEVKRAFIPYGILCERFPAIEHEHGFVGCALSHLALIEKAKKNHWPWIIVIEDDCILREPMNEWKSVKSFLMKKRDQWDVFFGGATYVSPLKNQSVNDSIDMFECIHALATHFTIYNESAYDRILSWHDSSIEIEKRAAIDIFLNMQPFKKWVIFPFIAWQEVGHSDVKKQHVNYDDRFTVCEKVLSIFRSFEALCNYKKGMLWNLSL